MCVVDSENNLPNSIEEHNATLCKTLVKDWVLNSDILRREVDGGIVSDPKISLRGSLEQSFSKVLQEWQSKHFCLDKQVAEEVGGL